MLLQATLTESHKTDIRDNETKLIDGLLEKQNRENKEPTSQFYGLVQTQEISTIGNNGFTFGLQNSGNGFYRVDTANTNYTAPAFLPLWDSVQSFSIDDLDFQSVEKIRLSLFVNWYRRSNAVSYASNFSFDLYCNIAEVSTQNPETIGVNDYSPFLKIKVGTVTYNSANNTFSNIYKKINLDLSDFTQIQNFISEETKLTQTQYDKLKTGNTRLAVFFGFDTSLRSVAELQFMNNRPFINASVVQLQYKGLSKI